MVPVIRGDQYVQVDEPLVDELEQQEMVGFVPQITVFVCIYCAYMSADTAGALRVQYPANVKMIKLPCTGKVDARYLLEAFEQGADGVCVVGCPIGNCHHVSGNKRAEARVAYVQNMLDEVGLGRDRLGMYFVTGGMGVTYAKAIREMAEKLQELGPSPLNRSEGSRKLHHH
jgi:coenzyme F420-reducing hydrogenase delta subunit